MCGIVGFILKPSEEVVEPSAQTQDTPETPFCGKDFLYSGLQRLTYRGYDSCGIAVLHPQGNRHKISLQKTSGKVERLEPLLDFLPTGSIAGLAHTRWATHGPPTSINAHPHRLRGLALVHNGIVENSDKLAASLHSLHPTFLSETDSEVALWTLHGLLKTQPMEEAILALTDRLQGSYTMALIHEKEPAKIYLIKQGSPLVVGFSEQGAYCASDVFAIESHAEKVLFLNDGDVGVLTYDHYQSLSNPLPASQKTYHDLPNLTTITADDDVVDKGGYAHYMYKEIQQQPQVLGKMIHRFVDFDLKSINADELGFGDLDLSIITHVHFVGCGSAYYASLIGKVAMESLAVMPSQASQASEYRYSNPVITPHTLVIAVSQSGETADTLACVRHALSRDAQVLALCNVRYSSLCRAATSSVLMGVGKEVGVASSKAFTAQVACLYLMACLIHRWRGLPVLDIYGDLYSLQEKVKQTLKLEPSLIPLAHKLATQKTCLLIGRYVSSAIAYEGALKLKEITYIHAEAYPAGELKHGPLALVDSQMVIIAIIPHDNHYPKMLSNIEEVCARGARVTAIASQHDPKLSSLCENVVLLPALRSSYLQSLLSTVALQLIAYHTAVHLGHDVDQPRNLAKSVTVE